MALNAGVTVQSSQLQNSGQQNVQGANFPVYSSGPLTPDQKLSLSLSGQATQADAAANNSPSTNTHTELFVGIGALGIVLILAGLWMFRGTLARGKKAASLLTQPDALSVDVVDHEDSETLVDAIIALDEKYRAGEIPEAAYQERRAELKARLKSKLG